MQLRNQKSNHISTIRSLSCQSRQISNQVFQKKIKSIFQENKRKYTSNTIWLATSISQVGQISLNSTVECMRLIYEFLTGKPPQNWLATTTLNTWHKDMSKIYIDTQINQLANASAYGIMVDESTRGEIKNFIMCYQFWNQSCQAPAAIMTHLQIFYDVMRILFQILLLNVLNVMD